MTRPLILALQDLHRWVAPETIGAFDIRPLVPDDTPPPDARVLLASLSEPLPEGLLDRWPGLKLIISPGSGIEGADRADLARRGIEVFNTPGETAEDVADLTLTIVLALYLRLLPLHAGVVAGEWRRAPRVSLREKTVGIVGLGGIGKAIAHRLATFGPEIRWTGPHPKDAPFAYEPSLDALADWADILIVAARADPSNARMIDAAILDRLGPDGLIANISRGSIIDEDALIAALKEGRIGGAALDVFDPEPPVAGRWEDVPNIVLTPHIGGVASGTVAGIRRAVDERVRRFFDSEP